MAAFVVTVSICYANDKLYLKYGTHIEKLTRVCLIKERKG